MTHFAHWQTFMRDIGSPESYITFGFYTMIAACLQRRVWYEIGIKRLYPNIYTIFVGNPAIGKGQVLTEIAKLVKFHKLRTTPSEDDKLDKLSLDTDVADIMASLETSKVAGLKAIPLVFPTPADSGSLRSLTAFLANATRRVSYKELDPKTGEMKEKVYSHNSAVFLLEELASVLKSQAETIDFSFFLIQAWDCGEYRHETFHHGCDVIRKICVSLLAGASPKFMKRAFDTGLVEEGFGARCLFIFEVQNRFDRWCSEVEAPEQTAAREAILAHILRLSKLYGRVSLSDSADAYMKDFVENRRARVRKNLSPKLDFYYGRKDMHILKLAAAIHFAETTEMTIQLESLERAYELLDGIEERMHLALQVKGANPLANVGRDVIRYVKRNGPKSKPELLLEFIDEINREQLDEIIGFLISTRQAKMAAGEDGKQRLSALI